MVYSEELQDWVPRWGKGSINKVKEQFEVIKHVKPGEENVDLFAKSEAEKKLKVKKQKLNELQNQLRKSGVDPNKVKDAKPKRGAERTKRKKILKEQRDVVHVSTASMGKFDYKTNEEIIKKKVVRKQKIHFKNLNDEKSRNKALMKKLLMK
jgi:hypothetical protein